MAFYVRYVDILGEVITIFWSKNLICAFKDPKDVARYPCQQKWVEKNMERSVSRLFFPSK